MAARKGQPERGLERVGEEVVLRVGEAQAQIHIKGSRASCSRAWEASGVEPPAGTNTLDPAWKSAVAGVSIHRPFTPRCVRKLRLPKVVT